MGRLAVSRELMWRENGGSVNVSKDIALLLRNILVGGIGPKQLSLPAPLAAVAHSGLI